MARKIKKASEILTIEQAKALLDENEIKHTGGTAATPPLYIENSGFPYSTEQCDVLKELGAVYHGRQQKWTYYPESVLRRQVVECMWDRNWKAKRIAKELEMEVDEVWKIMASDGYCFMLEKYATAEIYDMDVNRRIKNYLIRIQKTEDPVQQVMNRTGMGRANSESFLYHLESKVTWNCNIDRYMYG